MIRIRGITMIIVLVIVISTVIIIILMMMIQAFDRLNQLCYRCQYSVNTAATRDDCTCLENPWQ